MEHLQKKPFYLNDEDILWVGNTLADLDDEERIEMMIITPQNMLPFAPVLCTQAEGVRAVQNAGFAALVVDFAGDEKGAACINEGVMAIQVAPGFNRMDFNGLVVAAGFVAGCDMFFSGGSLDEDKECVKKCIAEGTLTQAHIRASVIQILGVKAALGLHL